MDLEEEAEDRIQELDGSHLEAVHQLSRLGLQKRVNEQQRDCDHQAESRRVHGHRDTG